MTTKNTGGKYRFDKRYITLVRTEINVVSFPDEIYISYYFEMIDISKKFEVVFTYEESAESAESAEFAESTESAELAKLNGSTRLTESSKLIESSKLETVLRNLIIVSKYTEIKLRSLKKIFESPTKKYVVTYCQKQKYNMLKNNNVVALYHSLH